MTKDDKVFLWVMGGFLLFIGGIIGVAVYEYHYIKLPRWAAQCETGVLGGTVTKLDYSGGWNTGVLVEFGEAGAKVVRSYRTLPGVGQRAYVCKGNHAHAGEPERWER